MKTKSTGTSCLDGRRKASKEKSARIFFALPYISIHSCLLVNIQSPAAPHYLRPSLSLSRSHPLSLQPAASLSLKRGHCLSYVPRGMLGELAWPGPQQLKSTLILLVSVREERGAPLTPVFLQLPGSSAPLIITIQIMSQINVSLKQSWFSQTITMTLTLAEAEIVHNPSIL